MAVNPLDSLRQQIEAAAALPGPEPYVSTGDPLRRLHALLSDEPADDDATETIPSSDLQSALGREVLEMVGSTPLAADAREEAVRRLTVALHNPTKDNVRAVLRVLVTGRVDV